MIASVRSLTGRQPKMYFGDSSRPDAATVRDLREEACASTARASSIRSGSTSIRRHGYKGGLELTATVDYIFGFDATAHVAPDFVYEGLAAEYALSPEMQQFLEQSNPWALHAIADRLLEAADRGLWEDAGPSDARGAAGRPVEGRRFRRSARRARAGALMSPHQCFPSPRSSASRR